jgi:hypothetical protein
MTRSARGSTTRRRWQLSTFVLALVLVAPSARAVDIGPDGAPLSVEVHGFVSQGFILSTNGNNYLSADSTRGSFQFSEVGLNFTKSLTDRFRVGVQLFAQDLGPTGNYDAKLDWFYLDYRVADWLGLRAGRVKIPFGLYNEVNDIDQARLPVLLPQSVYPLEDRNFLLAQTGAEVYGYVSLHSAGAFEYRLYGGTIFFDTLVPPGSPYQIVSLNVPYLVGGRLLWETPIQGLRLAGSVQDLRLDGSLLDGTTTVNVQIPATLWVGSLEYAADNWLLSAEYSRWSSKSNTTDPKLFPPSPTVTSERAYGLAAYRVTPWLQTGAYYSVLFPDVAMRSGRQNIQNDIALMMRFDINNFWLVKLEAHGMLGTAGLQSYESLNNNTPLNALAGTWGVFLAKTTAYF